MQLNWIERQILRGVCLFKGHEITPESELYDVTRHVRYSHCLRCEGRWAT